MPESSPVTGAPPFRSGIRGATASKPAGVIERHPGDAPPLRRCAALHRLGARRIALVRPMMRPDRCLAKHTGCAMASPLTQIEALTPDGRPSIRIYALGETAATGALARMDRPDRGDRHPSSPDCPTCPRWCPGEGATVPDLSSTLCLVWRLVTLHDDAASAGRSCATGPCQTTACQRSPESRG